VPSKPPPTQRGPDHLPDFRNLGIFLRALLLAEAARFVFLLVERNSIAEAVLALGSGTSLYEAALLATLLVLFFIAPWLSRFSFWAGARIGIVLAAAVAMTAHALFAQALPDIFNRDFMRTGILAGLVSGLVFFYLHWRQMVLSPALSDARLMALQARIRPHFLFNSLNTVLSLIRPDPARAESVLENLADLFRALMSDPRSLVSLQRELELARTYVEVESLRLEDRLKVVWHCENAPMHAEVPQLILQPLIENAVLHGIEPATEGGEVHVNIFVKGDRLHMVIRNPLLAARAPRPGNHMALANIRERLDLHFDAEARMTHFTAGGEFVVQVEIPLRKTEVAKPPIMQS
jgi:two-component system sensor histidine kinase AlgZ